jgi:hypothetical protein
MATNESRRTVTNNTGYYEVTFLEPSTYRVNVEANGFKKLVRSGIEVNVASRLEINLQLEVGGLTETVEVTAEAPLLETTTASGGRVLDNKQLLVLPLSDQNPFALSSLAPGMQWTGQPEYRRPFDNAGTSSFNTMGGVGQNEYTVDGSTVTGTNRRVGFVPPMGSITEFKLETSNFDASQGFTSGASINVVSKSGTNRLRGYVMDQHWQQRWNATGHFTRLKWEDEVRRGVRSPDSEKQATGRSNNYELALSGPVYIPKIFNGKDKLFWTLTWNGIRQSKAESTDSVNRTVPSEAMRQGDLSELWNAPNGVNLFTIYDPRSARREGNGIVRTPFPGNKGIPVLNPMYQFYVKLFPTPNNVPGLVTPEGYNNYLAFAMPKDEKFNSIVNRFDYIVNDKHRINFRWQWNDRLANEYDWTYETMPGLHSNGLTRINRGGNIGYLFTINSTNILDANFAISRFEEGSRRSVALQFGPKDVGLPEYLDQRAGANHLLPRLDFNNITDVSDSYPAIGSIGTTGELRLTMTTIKGSHTFKYGWQERRNYWSGSGPGNSSGLFTFRNNWTRKSDTDNISSNHGHDWAGFMMGMPTGIAIDTNDSTYFRTPRRALFFQDDFRVSSKLRLSLGLRYEREGGIGERYNRAIAGPFLGDAVLPFSKAAEAAYATSPIPELPAAQFKVLGGTSYLGQNGYDTATKGTHIFLPKIGVVFSMNEKTVIRAGWGMYMDTLNSSNTRPDTFGYNQSTGTPISNDAGLTFCCSVGDAANIAQGRAAVNDPFPVRANGTRFDEPLKNALGLIPRVGRGYTSLPWDFRPALQNRWRIGFQREILRNTVLDLSYNGAYATIWAGSGQRIDALPQEFWATGTTRNQALDNNLNANVTNPYYIGNFADLNTSNPTLYNYMAGQSFFTSKVIRKHQLLRPYGQMSGLYGLRPDVSFKDALGYNTYHDLELMVERRFARGFTTTAMYTHASGYAADYFRNEFDTTPSERINNSVLPHRFAWSSVWELPFGKGRSMLKDGFLSYVVGNWNLGWVYQRQSGPALDWLGLSSGIQNGTRFFYGDVNSLGAILKHDQVHGGDIHTWFDPSISFRGTGDVPSGFVGFEGRSAAQPGSYQVRTFQQRSDALRADGIRNWDVKIERIFPILPERGLQARFSLDMLNATNHTNFGSPNTDPTNGNFGMVTSQRGLPRILQFNLRVDF